MTRFIEIFADDDIQLLTTDDLPLIVSLDSEKFQIINICKRNEVNQLGMVIHCAYIAEEDGHLFLQPEINSFKDKKISIFHNDELISKSIWIKSGDVIRIENKVILFKISGDRIEIKIIDSKETKLLSPPPIEELIVIKAQNDLENPINKLPEIKQEKKYSQNKSHSLRKNGLIIILIVLSAIAGFMIIAESVTINIEPEAEEIELTGKFPVIKLADRFLAVRGNYNLHAKRQGYKTLNKTININSENNLFLFQMQETPGLVIFNIEPLKNNDLYINDQLLGNGIDDKQQPIKYEIDKGEYVLKVINPKYKKFKQKIKIEGQQTVQTFSISLQPNWGVVVIESKPEYAQIDINSLSHQDNNLFLSTEHHQTPASIELVAGLYELTVSKDKYKSRTVNLNVDAEKKIRLDTIELQAKDARIKLDSIPKGALVRVDGQYRGKTPVSLGIKPFIEHEIETSLSGYNDKKQKVRLEADSDINLHVKLEPVSGSVFIGSSPTQAKLYINGILQKRSSGKFILEGKNNTLMVKAKGYKSQTKKINADSYTKNISFILERNPVKKTDSDKKISNKNDNIKKIYKNSIGLKMILIKPGEFIMGSAKNEIGRRSNEPEHRVKITKAFYLSDKEISNQQYKQFDSNHNSGFSSGQSLDISRQPVVNVSWHDAAKFANWLSKKEGLQPYYKEVNGKMIAVNLSTNKEGYRLPFEAEWEYVARGQSKNKYPWNGSYPPKHDAGNFADESARRQVSLFIEGYNDSYGVAAPVGSFKSNESGFFDMGGNVSEWCQDFYIPYSAIRELVIDPVGPERGNHKVVRDSSWKDASITELRLSYRGYSKKAMNDIGFRIARTAL